MEKVLPRDVEELVLRYLEGLGTPRALTVAIMVRFKEWDAIATLQCVPGSYISAESYARDNAATALLRKSADLPTSFDREANARENWWKGEMDCFRSNERLERYLPKHSASADRVPEIAAFFARVKKRVYSWIGAGPKHLTMLRFGPGATYSDRGQLTTVPDKMSSTPTLTRDAMWYLPQWVGSAWGKHCASQSRSPSFVPGNRFAAVPKDATKFRAIATEPSINICFQLGLGRELRAKMKSQGIDLVSGQLTHRKVAAESSAQDGPATLDATNASDSVCYNLVKLCMPNLWFEALASLRSTRTLIDNKWVVLEKFSSMGNGYTFELETIIFAALCCEALASNGLPHRLGNDVYVYGDDMIVPRDGADVVTSVLGFCGIQLNLKKSFAAGDFRESCGGDFFAGSPVRPFYIDEFPKEPQDWMTIANGITRVTWELGRCLGDPSSRATWDPESRGDGFHPQGETLRRAWHYAVSRIPRRIARCRGPRGLGDIVINDKEDFWQYRWRSSIRWVNVWRPARYKKVSYGLFHPDVVLACAVYGLRWGGGGVIPRDSVAGYKLGWRPYS